MEFALRELRIDRCRAADLIDLRHVVLRAGLARETAMFPGDDDLSARHFIARWKAQIVGCATLHLSAWQDEPAWQLRGMAVAESFRRAGVGSALLRAIDDSIAGDSAIHLLWCNCRASAIPFYAKHRWQIASEPFELSSAGPHVRMIKRT